MPASKWTVLDTLPSESRQDLLNLVGKKVLTAARNQQDTIPVGDITGYADDLSNKAIENYLQSNAVSPKNYRDVFEFLNNQLDTGYSFSPARKMNPSHRDYNKFQGENIYGVTDPMEKTIYIDTNAPNFAETALHELGHAKERKQDPSPLRGISEAKYVPIEDALNGLSAIDESRWGKYPAQWVEDTRKFPFIPDVQSLPFNERYPVIGSQHLREENRPYNLLNQLQGITPQETTYLPQDIPMKQPRAFQRYLDLANLERTAQMTGLRDLLGADKFNYQTGKYEFGKAAKRRD